MKKILITGGAGYIGSHACKLIAASGYEPICFDNLSTGHADFVKWGPLVIGDLLDIELLTKVLRLHQPSAVIHFAASAYVGESVLNPFKYYRNNVGGTLSLLESMRAADVKNIVFSSTCATYGVPNLESIKEDCIQNPINPYGQSKLMIEKILSDLASKNQIAQVSLRYFNAAGADQEVQIGEKHFPETHLIPLAINSALGGEELNIFGADFKTPDGTAVRDYIHVEDLGRAHILALEHLLAGGNSECINLGTGLGSSVLQIVSALQNLGLKVNFRMAPRREGDPDFLVANASKAHTLLNWQPKYKKIDDILRTAIAWHTKK